MEYFYGAFWSFLELYSIFAPFHFYCIEKNGENILPYLSFCFSGKIKSTGLEKHEGEWIMPEVAYPFYFQRSEHVCAAV